KKHPVHAGTFYPSSGQEIMDMFEAWVPERKPIPGLRGLILPHAGYAYSGHVAARGYAAIPTGIKRVLLLGPSHHYPVRGILVWDEGSWETPLGEVQVSRDSAVSLLKADIFQADPRPFIPEHSLEVQMPFIKHFMPQAAVVPMIAGDLNSHGLEEAADAIRQLLDGETIMIASSDFYHGHSYEECLAQDKETISLIKRMNGKEFLSAARQMRVMACGDMAIAVLIETVAGLPGCAVDVLMQTNSADVISSCGYIVGYAAVALTAR
ncbi:MAG: AmmeMemoRadiSam system protein B, partial [Candidatus Hydrothermia bacterium]